MIINNFLQMGGARNEQEFYSKYPTRESFMNAHPEGQMLEAMFRMGGGYQPGGGYPQQEDYGDNIEAFQQAQEDYISSLPVNNGIPSMPATGAIPQFIKAPAENPMIGAGPGSPSQVSAPQSSYRGNSIADYLKSIGQDGSFAARKQMFGPGYRGTAKQNMDALETLRVDDTPIETIGVDNRNTSVVTKKKAPSVPVEQQTGPGAMSYKPFTTGHSRFPGLSGIPTATNVARNTAEKNSQSGSGLNWQGGDKLALIGAGLAGATAAGAIGFFDLMYVADIMENDPQWKGKAKGKLTKSINELRKQALQNAGADVKKVAEMWDKLPKKAQKLYMANFADPQMVNDIISGQIHTMPASSAVNHLATYNSSQALENALTANDELTPYLDDIAAEKKAWHTFRTRQGKGLIPAVPAPIQKAAPSWMQSVGQNLMKNAKHLVRREAGGTYDNGMFYQTGGTPNIANFAVGGEYDLCEQDVQTLINQGYTLEYL